MKLVKMSIAAAVLLGASAFAIDNVKVDGDAKLYYITNNMSTNKMLNKDASAADTAIRIGVTGDLMKGLSFGLTGYGVSTLGLENNLVSNTFTGAHTLDQTKLAAGMVDVKDQAWMGEAWLAATVGKTTVKLGRMALDTPLAFSETWSVTPNTFEAAVLINQDLPDTTLVGAWVGKGNGVNALSPLSAPHNNVAQVGVDGFMGMGASFGTFVNKGAYAAAAVNNSFKPLTAQAWYYNVVNVADAFWLQGDLAMEGFTVGAQYANISTKGLAAGFKDSSAYAAKVGYEGVQNLKVSAAYSKADKDGALKIANVATNNLGGAQSKLYTEAYWNYGYVGAPDARTYTGAAEYNAKDIATFGAQYTDVSGQAAGAVTTTKMKEAAVYASKDVGPLNATLAYFSTKATDQDNNNRYDSVLAMLKLKF